MLTVNVVVLAGTVAADPVTRRMPSGDEVTELRISVPETGRRLLPLPVAAWHATVGRAAVDAIAKGDAVAAYILPSTTPERILASIGRGERLPRKSTFFWPKPRTGLVLMPVR